MARSNQSSSIPVALRRQLAIPAALATERLMEVNFRYAMELVEHAREQLDPARAVAIYSRLHGLRASDAEALHQRVFVALGRRLSQKSPVDAGLDTPPPESPQSVLGVIRRRLRGRVNAELREWVEFHTGRAETELLWAHVENALQFIQLLRPERDVGEAVAMYSTELELPDARTETIYYLTLAHLSGSTLVTVPEDATHGLSGAARPTLRIGANRIKPGRRQAG